MGDVHTFSLALVFNQGFKNAVCTIVCHSDEPIDKTEVRFVASNYLQQAMANNVNIKDLTLYVLDGIKQECDVEAVLVNADAACFVGLKSNF